MDTHLNLSNSVVSQLAPTLIPLWAIIVLILNLFIAVGILLDARRRRQNDQWLFLGDPVIWLAASLAGGFLFVGPAYWLFHYSPWRYEPKS